MGWLDWTLYAVYDFFSQEVARHNAAIAAGRLMDQRQQQADVEAYLTQRHQRFQGHLPPAAAGAAAAVVDDAAAPGAPGARPWR